MHLFVILAFSLLNLVVVSSVPMKKVRSIADTLETTDGTWTPSVKVPHRDGGCVDRDTGIESVLCSVHPFGFSMASCGQCCTDATCEVPKPNGHGGLAFSNFDMSEELPTRTITAEERHAYFTRGIVVLRGVIPRRKVALELAKMAWRHSEAYDFPEYMSEGWNYSPVARALALSNVTKIISKLQGAPGHTLVEAPIWAKSGGSTTRQVLHPSSAPATYKSWHSDESSKRFDNFQEQMSKTPGDASAISEFDTTTFDTFWLALSDAPGALEFATYTNTFNASLNAYQRCHMPIDTLGPVIARGTVPAYGSNETCLIQWQKDRGLNYDNGFFRPDLRAGDAIVFNGYTIHTGVHRELPRVAISLRYSPRTSPQSSVSSKPHNFVEAKEFLLDAPWGDYSTARTGCVQQLVQAEPHLGQLGMRKELARAACEHCSWSPIFMCNGPTPTVDVGGA